MALENLDLVNFLFPFSLQVIFFFFENQRTRHVLMPQFDTSCNFLKNFIAQSMFFEK